VKENRRSIVDQGSAMSTDHIRLLRRVQRDANAVVVSVVGRADDGAAFREQLADLHTLVLSALTTDHPAPKRVVLDLRRLDALSPRMVGELTRFDRFLRAARTELVFLATATAAIEVLRGAGLDHTPPLFSDAGELEREHGITLPATEDESVTFTAAELRDMRAAGVTLGDAIRAIEIESVRRE